MLVLSTAGSTLEAAIFEGPEKLNAFIDAGHIEELSDVITKTDDTDESDNEDNNDNALEPDRKRPRRIRNHNAQVIYKNSDPNVPIPSLMKMNDMSSSPWSQPPPNMDAWNTAPPIMNAGQPPPSLLNLNVGRPGYDESNGNNSWQQQQQQLQPSTAPPPHANDFNARTAKTDAARRRNRDSEGNRISRFDQNSRPTRFDSIDNARNNNNTNNRRNNRRI